MKEMNMEHVSNSKMIKEINEQKVLRLIYSEGPIARVNLAKKTGLTQQTITNIVNRLLNENVIIETSATVSGGGRRPIPLEMNSSNLFAIGIELAIKYIKGSLIDFKNNPIKEVVKLVPLYKNESHPMEYIFNVIETLLDYVPDSKGLKGIGLSIQGLVDSKNGTIIYSPGLGWRNFPLKERLEIRYGSIPIYLENDANLIGVVECLNGVLADSKHSVTFKFDYGVGSAFIFNGQLINGANCVAGEFGHYKTFSGKYAKPCHCGSKGCLTTLASISGLRRNLGIELNELISRIRNKDPEALRLYAKIKCVTAKAIANVVTLLNPEYILFTGRIIDQVGDFVIPVLEKEIKKMVPDTCSNFKIQVIETPDESKTAAGLVMNYFLDIPLDKFY